MAINKKIQLETIKSLIVDIRENIEGVDEYGYVGNYGVTDAELKELSDKILYHLEEANKHLDNLSTIIKDQFEY
jgi:hypothetical protein